MYAGDISDVFWKFVPDSGSVYRKWSIGNRDTMGSRLNKEYKC